MLATKPKAEDILKDAFRRFDESSRRLQRKYEALLKETEALRKEVLLKEQELKRNEKLALLGETAAALAHEVRNPLGSIKLFISLLRRDFIGNESAIGVIDNIDRSVAALDNVVANILRFSKKEELEYAVINIHSIIQEQISFYTLAEQNRLKFNLSLDAKPFIQGNEQALRQVFYNLFLNAAQALRHSGHIDVKTENYSTGIKIIISDDGPGIDKKIISRIFDPFVTTKNEGTGLGLAVVSQIISMHHGRIDVKDKREWGEKGTEFQIFLSRIPEKSTGDKHL